MVNYNQDHKHSLCALYILICASRTKVQLALNIFASLYFESGNFHINLFMHSLNDHFLPLCNLHPAIYLLKYLFSSCSATYLFQALMECRQDSKFIEQFKRFTLSRKVCLYTGIILLDIIIFHTNLMNSNLVLIYVKLDREFRTNK